MSSVADGPDLTRRLAQRATSALINAVLLGTFALVPLLDGVAVEYDAVIESEHGACDYVRTHDHAICVQYGGNLPTAGGPPATAGFHAGWARVDTRPVEVVLLRGPALALERTRAPPTA